MIKKRMVEQTYEVCDTCGIELDYSHNTTYPKNGVCSLECGVFKQFDNKQDYLKSIKE